ncbi:MAG: chemotaxis protein CheW [Kofleriaceae bacterium]|nr:chemotaxis protein CheW [Kofleriaceae bacterium]
MSDSRNVIVFAVGELRYAFEIRWIREVVTLGFVTTVPSAPPALCGVCNLHGHIVPVIDVTAIVPGAAPSNGNARQGDGALLIDIAGSVMAVRLEKIDRVASYEYDGHYLLDGASQILLLEPVEVHRLVAQQIAQVGNREELASGERVVQP